MRHLLFVLVVFVGVLAAPARPAGAPQAGLDALLGAYAAGDYQVLHRTVTTLAHFEKVRKELGYEKNGLLFDGLERWNRDRRPVHHAFMLDLALVGYNRGWIFWLDVIEEGRKFLTMRPEPPGANPAWDALELSWHKASIALLQSLRRPELLEKHGLAPLADRVAATTDEPGTAAGGPRLVDPWIALARGVNEEQFSVTAPSSLATRGVAALAHFEEAARHDATRDEARVRQAWLLVRLNRPADALARLDALTAEPADPAVAYWRQIFRGRALEALDRAADAERAYRDALAIVPDAQAPAVALTALELRRDNRDAAYEWAAVLRRAPTNLLDPWWQYFYADFRLFRSRVVDLRRKAADAGGADHRLSPRDRLDVPPPSNRDDAEKRFFRDTPDRKNAWGPPSPRDVAPFRSVSQTAALGRTRGFAVASLGVGLRDIEPVTRAATGAQAPVFRRAVDSVELNVAVMNRNKPVAELKVEDFEVLDNGVRQAVREVTYETQPIDLTLVLDTSGSVTGARFTALVNAVNRLRARLRPDDRVAVLTFDQRIRDLFGLQPARGSQPLALRQGEGPTSLYDAIAVALAAPPPAGRRQMAIVFTDGIDTISFLDEPAVLDVARRSHTAVFIVALGRLSGMIRSGTTFSRTIAGPLPEAFFAEVAGITGGASQVVPEATVESTSDGSRMSVRANENILDAPFLKAFDDFRTSYVLRYTLEGVPRPGWHDVTVRVPRGRDFTVRARRGYDGGR